MLHAGWADWRHQLGKVPNNFGRYDMRNRLYLVVLMLLSTAAIAQDKMAERLRKAIVLEEANQNLGNAIQAYQAILGQYEEERKSVGAALFHLADCYRKQGKSDQAIAAYKRVVQEFPDQIKLADASRNYLSKTFGIDQDQTSASKTSERQSALAREKYRKLLEEEIKLVEMRMNVLDKQLQIGTVNPDGPEIYSAKRELVELQQRLAAFDAGIIQLPATPFKR